LWFVPVVERPGLGLVVNRAPRRRMIVRTVQFQCLVFLFLSAEREFEPIKKAMLPFIKELILMKKPIQ
jgi:hypothetical protein